MEVIEKDKRGGGYGVPSGIGTRATHAAKRMF